MLLIFNIILFKVTYVSEAQYQNKDLKYSRTYFPLFVCSLSFPILPTYNHGMFSVKNSLSIYWRGKK